MLIQHGSFTDGHGSMVYRGSLGRCSTVGLSSTFPNCSDPVHTEIHESGRGLLAGLEEVFAVRTMGTQFTPDRIPLDIHPSNEKISLNDSVGLHVARKRKIWQRDASLPTRDTIIKRDSGDTQMDVDDALRLPLRHEQILK